MNIFYVSHLFLLLIKICQTKVSKIKVCNSLRTYKQFLYVACWLYRFYSLFTSRYDANHSLNEYHCTRIKPR